MAERLSAPFEPANRSEHVAPVGDRSAYVAAAVQAVLGGKKALLILDGAEEAEDLKADLAAARPDQLGGRFVQQTGDVDKGEPNQIGMYTYDSNRRTYRYWFFHSSGFFVDSTGTWNESSQTFTFTNKPFEGATGVITVYFLDGTTYDWSIINKDAGGAVVFHMEGKAVRQK